MRHLLRLITVVVFAFTPLTLVREARLVGAVAPEKTTDASCGPEHERGLIIYFQGVVDSGTPIPQQWEMVAVTPNGAELHRVALPELMLPTPLGTSCKALVQDGSVYLFDPTAGTLHELRLPMDVDSLVVRSDWPKSVGSRWTLLTDDSFHRALLLDLDSREISDLSAITGQDVVENAQLSAREDYVLLNGALDAWLIPTANPEQARSLGGETIVRYGGFSPEGERIVFTEQLEIEEGDYDYRVVVQSIDGSQSDTVAVSDNIVFSRFLPAQNAVILNRRDRVSVLSLDDLFERELLTLPGGQGALLYFSPSGRHLLVEEWTGDSHTWHLVDVEAGLSTRLDELGGKKAWASPFVTARWLFFSDVTDGPLGMGASLFSVDLDTGIIHRLLEADDENTLLSPGSASTNTRFVTVASIGHVNRYELFDLEQGSSRLLTPDGHGASLSPDGRSVAVLSALEEQSRFESQLVILDIEGGGKIPVGIGTGGLVWLSS